MFIVETRPWRQIWFALLVLTMPVFSQDSQSTQQNKFPELHGPYLGQKPPGKTPELFAPGTISTDLIEHSSPAFSPEGDVVLWTPVKRDKYPNGYLLEMRNVNGVWLAPASPSFAAPDYDDIYASFSPDGKKFYFSSRRPLPESGVARRRDEGMRIWVVDRLDKEWGVPAPLDLSVSPGDEYAHSVSRLGTLYFSSSRDGSKGALDIYCSRLVNGKYQLPEHLDGGINTEGYEDGPFIAPDESYLIFESDRPGSIDGSIDLYICFKGADGSWTPPRNMGPTINTKYSERFARLSPDGKYLFFSSNPNGNYDSYWFDAKIIDKLKPIEDDTFSALRGTYLGQRPPGAKPELFASGILGSLPTFSPDGQEVFWQARMKDAGRAAIFTASVKDGIWQPAEVASFSGEFEDAYPTLSPDGKRLYFASHRPDTGQTPIDYWRIWFTERSGSNWSLPALLDAAVNSGNAPSVTETGTLYFASGRDGGKGKFDIYRAQYQNGRYMVAENLGDSVNTADYDVHPWIARDESYLLFATQGRSDSIGGADLYVSFRKSDGTWAKARNLGSAINSPKNEWYASVSPDGRYLFLVSDRSGKAEVYWINAKIIEELKPKDLK